MIFVTNLDDLFQDKCATARHIVAQIRPDLPCAEWSAGSILIEQTPKHPRF